MRDEVRTLGAAAAEARAAAEDATSRATALAADNAKLHDALRLLQNNQSEKADEVARLLTANAALRSERLKADAERADAADRAAQWERQFKSQEQVWC